jgi:hypothetical protein
MAQRQILHLVEQATDNLPEAFPLVFVARVIEGMSIEETSELLGIKPETVKTRLHRARQLVRDRLESEIGPILTDAFPFAGRRCERLTETSDEAAWAFRRLIDDHQALSQLPSPKDGFGPQHPDMPDAAISAGLIDFAVPVEEMSEKLADFAKKVPISWRIHSQQARLPIKPIVLMRRFLRFTRSSAIG